MPGIKFKTIAQAIAEIGGLVPENSLTFQDLKGDETEHTYVEIEALTAQRAAALQALGLQKGDRIGLIIIEPQDFVLNFFGALRVGIVPVPLYPPMSFGSLDAYAERTSKVLNDAEAKLVLVSGKLQNLLWSLVDSVDTLQKLITVESLRDATGTPTYPEIVPEDMAFLQYTSGSTSDPKGVMVTHASLIANAKGIMEEGLMTDPAVDKGISWLPLYHDMGLIGFVLAPVCMGISIVYIPTLRFIKRPNVWMETVHRHRGTISFGPNFAYALAARKAKPADLERWDLSCLRVLGCGAEPIQPETMRSFTEQFHTHCGLPTTSILPAYGMAEATLAISLKPANEPFRTVVCDAETFQENGTLGEVSDDRPILEHVSCGRAFKAHRVVAMNSTDDILAEGIEGELCMQGPSVTPGYFKNPQATAEAFRGGWLHTGDLGFVQDGEIFITGRLKDLIIVNGRNVHPQAVEWAAAEVEGVRKGNVVAFSRPSPTGEELVLVCESRHPSPEDLVPDIKKQILRDLSLNCADIVFLAPGSLPKTSSGKLQRRKTRQQYLLGKLGSEGTRTMGAAGSKRTIAKHVAKSLWSRAKNTLGA